MSNASRCLQTAAHYAELAEKAAHAELTRVYLRLELLWRDMAPLAADFDRRNDPGAKGAALRDDRRCRGIPAKGRLTVEKLAVANSCAALYLWGMSRAFVKETDDAPELPDRPVSEHPNYVTERGLGLIEAEFERYRSALASAQAAEDRDAIASASRELRYWTQRRNSAELQPKPSDDVTARFGSRVTIERDDGRKQTFTIVGEDEADPSKGTLSYISPLACALIGREVGDTVKVGQGEAEITKIEIR